MLLKGAHELQLTDDQKAAVTKVEMTFLADDGQSLPAALNAFDIDLATWIKAGKIDAAKAKADYEAIDKAAAAGLAKDGAAISGLHDALPTADRQSLASSVRARRAARDRIMPPASPDAGGPDWTKVRVDKLTRELTLDVDGGQPRKIEQLVATSAKQESPDAGTTETRREENKKRIEALLTAFEADALDVATLPLAPIGQKTPHEGAERAVTFDTALLPLLKQDQRDKLAMHVQRMGGRPGRFPEDGPVGGFEGGGDDFGPAMPMGPMIGPMGPMPR
jgi:hypothetical protein